MSCTPAHRNKQFTASFSSQLKGADQATEVPRPTQTGRESASQLGARDRVQAVDERKGARAQAGRIPKKKKTNEDQSKLGPDRKQLSRGQ